MKRQGFIVITICILSVIPTFAHAAVPALNNNLLNTYSQYNLSFLNNQPWNFQTNSLWQNNQFLQRTSMSNILNYTTMAYNPGFQSPMTSLYSNPNSRASYGYNFPYNTQYNTPGLTPNYLGNYMSWASPVGANPLGNIYSMNTNMGNWYTGNWGIAASPVVSNMWGFPAPYSISNINPFPVPMLGGGIGGGPVGFSARPSVGYATPLFQSSGYSGGVGFGMSGVYSGLSYGGGGGALFSGSYGASYGYSMAYSYSPSSYIGYSTGGAKDINNFRQNIDNDFLPIPTDVTYEGLFYDYYFDTGQEEACDQLFCASYRLAVTADPISDDKEYFMSVGLNSGIKKEDFQRKKLNLVVVLDVSGSMSSGFNSYYYDRFGNKHEAAEGEDLSKDKIRVANEALVGLIDHLNAEDRFGLVLFNSSAWIRYPMTLIGDTDVQDLKNDIMTISAGGSTNLASGIQTATGMFTPYIDIDHTQYENRIIFLTDLMPNTGDTSSSGLLGKAKNNANNKIYATFIGIGVDFNTELVEFITKIRGANYYSVFSPTDFKEQMDEEFEYMVTPLVFNLELTFASAGYEIEKVYGSPEADEATGELMKVNTLFPSKTTEEGTKGGIVLLKLSRLDPNDTTGVDANQIDLSVSYEDRLGNAHSATETITFGDIEPEYFGNTGTRKAILLTRYANLLKNWIIDERTSLKDDVPVESFMDEEDGKACIPIYTSVAPYVVYRCYPPTSPIPLEASVELGQWERQSTDLRVSDPYKQLFITFKTYFESEMAEIGDSTLSQEVDVLDKLSTYGN